MKTLCFAAFLISASLAGFTSQAAPLGSAFAYQGRLAENGSSANGEYDLQFTLHDAATGGSQVGGAITNENVVVTNGVFTTQLDFAAGAFGGSARWIELGVRAGNDSGGFVLLNPRQPVMPTPYALSAASANGLSSDGAQPIELRVNDQRVLRVEQTGPSPNILGGYSGNVVSNGIYGATIAGGGEFGASNVVNASFGTVSGGKGNQAWASGTVGGGEDNRAYPQHATVSGGRGNTAVSYGSVGGGSGNFSGSSATVGGGEFNQCLSDGAVVGGGYSNRAKGAKNVIGGGLANDTDGETSTVGGGHLNSARTNYATIAGGHQNIASGPRSTIGGGVINLATGTESTVGGGISNWSMNTAACVPGGEGNKAYGRASFVGGAFNTTAGDYSAVTGGLGNSGAGNYSGIAGGFQNRTETNALYAAIPGGQDNSVTGSHGFAAGRRAKANHPGAFVWADSTDADFVSSATNEFAVRASGGVVFYSHAATNSGVALAQGSGSWSMLSDRGSKENLSSVNGLEVLERVSSLPLHTWSYKSQDASIRHMGPVAQDFSIAFGLGEDDRHISSVDADGVALAAIQGLNEIVTEKTAKIQMLEQENRELSRRLAGLEETVAALARRLERIE
jgi:trimeric autotransporter adhesin